MHIIICSKSPSIVDAAALAFRSRPVEAGSPVGSDQPHVTVCDSGLEVLGAVQVVDADLLVLDMQTPGLNALLIISAIRELAPALPILALSAKPEEDARAFAHKGISVVRLPSGSGGDPRALVATLARVGEATGIAAPSDAGLR